MIDERNRTEVMLNAVATATPIDEPRDRLEIFASKIAGASIDTEPRDRVELLLSEIANTAYIPKSADVGSVATITGATDAPVDELEVSIVPVQAGSGDPAPDNVRAITGWSSADIVCANGKNMISMRRIANAWGMTYDANANSISGQNIPRKVLYSKLFKPNTRYTISFDYSGTNEHITFIGFEYSDGTQDNVNCNSLTRTHYTHTSNANKNVVGIFKSYYQTDTITLYDIQVEEGATATSYTPFTGSYANVSFGNTVYGGVLDVSRGIVTVTDGNIAEYDGEELPSTWISSMDVYAPDTTPTEGAQVVYKLATPLTIAVNPAQIRTEEGDNVIYADCGDIIKCTYFT